MLWTEHGLRTIRNGLDILPVLERRATAGIRASASRSQMKVRRPDSGGPTMHHHITDEQDNLSVRGFLKALHRPHTCPRDRLQSTFRPIGEGPDDQALISSFPTCCDQEHRPNSGDGPSGTRGQSMYSEVFIQVQRASRATVLLRGRLADIHLSILRDECPPEAQSLAA
jgi:hypothetical protein